MVNISVAESRRIAWPDILDEPRRHATLLPHSDSIAAGWGVASSRCVKQAPVTLRSGPRRLRRECAGASGCSSKVPARDRFTRRATMSGPAGDVVSRALGPATRADLRPAPYGLALFRRKTCGLPRKSRHREHLCFAPGLFGLFEVRSSHPLLEEQERYRLNSQSFIRSPWLALSFKRSASP